MKKNKTNIRIIRDDYDTHPKYRKDQTGYIETYINNKDHVTVIVVIDKKLIKVPLYHIEVTDIDQDEELV